MFVKMKKVMRQLILDPPVGENEWLQEDLFQQPVKSAMTSKSFTDWQGGNLQPLENGVGVETWQSSIPPDPSDRKSFSFERENELCWPFKENH